jgi:NAD(P) transhydrogenase subunit alpha
MIVAILKESYPGERRVALVPTVLPRVVKKCGVEVVVEAGAGEAAGFSDREYTDKGARIVADRTAAFSGDVVLAVRAAGANGAHADSDLGRLRKGQALIGMCDPLGAPQAIEKIAATGASLFALELMPRSTRAQSMDILSSMATVAGYRAVLLAAVESPRMFPLMMTAAGTVSPARVFVIGAGVAGLQAIATARRLGAVVRAYDVRPACREQVESLGAKFVEVPLETGSSEDKGGYAKAMDEEFYRKQRELMASVVAESDVVITTAAIPGRKSPVLVPAGAVARMRPGSVIVDLAAERGGNCELTRADEKVVEHGVTILGPTNLPADVPNDASTLYAGNLANFLMHLIKGGRIEINREDEITRETLVAFGGEIVHAGIRQMLVPTPA